MGYYVPNWTRLALGGATPSVLTDRQLAKYQKDSGNTDYIQHWDPDQELGENIGKLTVTGSKEPTQDKTGKYKVENDGDATIEKREWSIDDEDCELTNADTAEVTVNFKGGLGKKTLTVKLTDDEGDTKSTTYEVTVKEDQLGTVTVSGDDSADHDDSKDYEVAWDGGILAARISKFEWSITPAANGEITNGDTKKATIKFKNEGDEAVAATVTCKITTTGEATGSDDQAVTVAAKQKFDIGSLTITAGENNSNQAGEELTFTVANDGNADDIVWAWTAVENAVVTDADKKTCKVTFRGTSATRAGRDVTVRCLATSEKSDNRQTAKTETVNLKPSPRPVVNVSQIEDSENIFNNDREKGLTVSAADFVNQFVRLSTAGRDSIRARVEGWDGAVLGTGAEIEINAPGQGNGTVTVPATGVAYVTSQDNNGAWARVLAAAGVGGAADNFDGGNGEAHSLSWFMIINQTQLDANSDEDYEETIRHELLHGLGIGQFWGNDNIRGSVELTQNIALPGDFYSETLKAYKAAGAGDDITVVPAESAQGQNDEGLNVGDHWERDTRNIGDVPHPGVLNDIMLARAGEGLVLTQLSISNMGDHGYEEVVTGTVEGPLSLDLGRKKDAKSGAWQPKDYDWICLHHEDFPGYDTQAEAFKELKKK